MGVSQLPVEIEGGAALTIRALADKLKDVAIERPAHIAEWPADRIEPVQQVCILVAIPAENVVAAEVRPAVALLFVFLDDGKAVQSQPVVADSNGIAAFRDELHGTDLIGSVPGTD